MLRVSRSGLLDVGASAAAPRSTGGGEFSCAISCAKASTEGCWRGMTLASSGFRRRSFRFSLDCSAMVRDCLPAGIAGPGALSEPCQLGSPILRQNHTWQA